MKRRGFVARLLAALGVGAVGLNPGEAQEVAPPRQSPPAPPYSKKVFEDEYEMIIDHYEYRSGEWFLFRRRVLDKHRDEWRDVQGSWTRNDHIRAGLEMGLES